MAYTKCERNDVLLILHAKAHSVYTQYKRIIFHFGTKMRQKTNSGAVKRPIFRKTIFTRFKGALHEFFNKKNFQLTYRKNLFSADVEYTWIESSFPDIGPNKKNS